MEIIRDNDIKPATELCATIGMFDGVHLGHRALLAELRETAAAQGLRSAVVTFSEHPQRVLRPEGGLRMVMTLENRLNLLDEMGVDVVILMNFTREFSQLDSRSFMRLLRDKYGVKTLMMGFNHRFGHNKDEYFEDYVAHGVELGVKVVKAKEYHGEYSPVSSSLIRKMIEEGKVDLAQAYLSRPFELGGIVVHGKQNGRKIGFPTANIDISNSELVVPHKGVYAVTVMMEDGSVLGGMANIGVRPTIERGGAPTFEVNIFDFDGDLYGKYLTVSFVKFIRSETKMASLEELKKQLTLDEVVCREAVLRNKK